MALEPGLNWGDVMEAEGGKEKKYSEDLADAASGPRSAQTKHEEDVGECEGSNTNVNKTNVGFAIAIPMSAGRMESAETVEGAEGA